MFVVRFVALSALVLLIGAGVQAQFTFSSSLLPWMTGACGGVILVSLFIMKFVGPPPHAFTLRAAIAFVTIALSGYAALYTEPLTIVMLMNVGCGLVLLAWYARE